MKREITQICVCVCERKSEWVNNNNREKQNRLAII